MFVHHRGGGTGDPSSSCASSIVGTRGYFTVTKEKDKEKGFIASGTAYLKPGSPEGETRDVKPYQIGAASVVLNDDLAQGTFPKRYYVRVESVGGGYAGRPPHDRSSLAADRFHGRATNHPGGEQLRLEAGSSPRLQDRSTTTRPLNHHAPCAPSRGSKPILGHGYGLP